jgi:hypothetical protein
MSEDAWGWVRMGEDVIMRGPLGSGFSGRTSGGSAR